MFFKADNDIVAFLLRNNRETERSSASYVTKPNRACRVKDVSVFSLAFGEEG